MFEKSAEDVCSTCQLSLYDCVIIEKYKNFLFILSNYN